MDESNLKECRVCLKTENSNFISLFETYKNKLVHEHISSLADVTITLGDGLPESVCEACITDLDICLKFRQICESSARLLYIRTIQLTSLDIKKEKPEEFEMTYSPDEPCTVDVKFEPDLEPVIERNISAIKDNSSPECHDCGKCFKTKVKLQVHWKKAHKCKSQYVCPNCKIIFKTSCAYNKHRTGQSRHPCTMLAGSKDFRMDFRIEGEGKSRIFYCSHCDYVSKKVLHMKAHLVTHSGLKSFGCDMCDKAYTQLSSLISHRESVHLLYVTECHICGKTFNGKRRLYKHVKTHNEEKLQCAVCDKQLKGKRTMQNHMLRHSGMKSFTCELCAASFYTLSELTNHKKKHSVIKKDKNFQCHLCQYCTSTKYLLSRHMKHHVSGEKPYSCKICGYLFKTPQKLAAHERVHYDNNKYPCPLCNKTFFCRRSVSKHVIAKHNSRMLQRRVPSKLSIKQELGFSEILHE